MMMKRMPKLIIGGIAGLSVASVLTVTATAGSSDSSESCSGVDQPIAESKEFTPYEVQRGHLPETYLERSGEEQKERVRAAYPEMFYDTVEGLSLWSVVDSVLGSVTHYFVADASPEQQTLQKLFNEGGYVLRVEKSDESRSAESILQIVGSRGTQVAIGQTTGILVWSDPVDESGLRTHQVYWSLGSYDYSLEADVDSAQLVSAARRIACR